MTDPLSLIALGAAVGGATGKFVEKAWDSGEKWIASYFENHQPKAIEQAKKNSAEFLEEVTNRIKKFEDQNEASKNQIESAQEHPDFSATLHKALLTSATTDNKQKHQLLARVIAERLVSSPEGLKAMTSRMACEVIGNMTTNQLNILGLTASLYNVQPSTKLTAEHYSSWLSTNLSPFMNVAIKHLDILHLESLSCLKNNQFLGRSLDEILKKKNNDIFDISFYQTSTGKSLQELWTQGLQSIDLTSVGQLVGVYVMDLRTGNNTIFSDWE
jgi:hypothetical protein